MKIEDPNAYRYIMQDEIYLLKQDKVLANTALTPQSAFEAPQATPAAIAKTPPPTLPEPIVKTPGPLFNYLGKNKKNFLILVNYPAGEFIAHEHLTALQNILKRKELELDDVAILNTRDHPQAGTAELSNYFKPAKLLIMGEESVPAGAGKPVLNEPFKLDGYDALFSFSFAGMMESNDHKKAFWEQMKKL